MPLALVLGLGATAVGAGLDIAGNKESQNAENAERAKEAQQQKDLQGQASTVVNKNVTASSPQNVGTELNTAASQRQSAWEGLNDATAPVASALPATGGASTPTSRAQATAQGGANAWNNLVSGASSKLGAYGDVQNEQSIADQDTNNQLGTINNFSAGDANLLPLEMQVASTAGNKLSGWGSIVSSLGNLASLASAAGTFKTGAPQVAAVDPDGDIMQSNNLSQMFQAYPSGVGAPGSFTLPANNGAFGVNNYGT